MIVLIISISISFYIHAIKFYNDMNLMVYGLISYKNDPIKSFNMWTCLFLLPSRDMYKSYSTLICLWKIKCWVGLYYCGRHSVLRDHSSLWRRHHAVCWWGDQKILCIVKNYICLYEKRWNGCTCSKLSPENWSQGYIGKECINI